MIRNVVGIVWIDLFDVIDVFLRNFISVSCLLQNYQLLSGAWPTKDTDLVLVTDNKNTVNINSLKNLGFDVEDGNKVKFNKLIGKQFSVVSNNNYYQELPTGMFVPRKTSQNMYNSGTKLRLSAVIRPKNEDSMALPQRQLKRL